MTTYFFKDYTVLPFSCHNFVNEEQNNEFGKNSNDLMLHAVFLV